MAKLSDQDLKYYRKEIEDDISFHNSKMNEVNSPEAVIAAYNGKFYDKEMSKSSDPMVENYLFISGATALPSLFFQLPRMQIRAPNRPDLQFSSHILTGLLNATFTEKDKEENQLCIIDAFLPYGYAVMKNGYNSRTGTVEKPSVLTGEKKGSDPSNLEADNEYIKFEKAIGIRQSPKYTYLDRTQPFGKGNKITFEYTRTLQQLIDSNLYTLSTNFINYIGSRAKDKREVDLTIYESFWMVNGSCWKLVYTDAWKEEAICWEKTEYGELPISYLRFNKMGDVLYNISHGTLGLHAQKELNFLNELWKKHIENMRNQHLVHEDSLTESGRKTLNQNDIGGIVRTSKPLGAGIAQALTSAPMDANLFNNIMNVREYLKLLMSVSGSKMGGPESDLATVERAKEMGDALRSGGMQDNIRGFMVSQMKQRLRNILKMGSPEMIITLTGENITNPMTGKTLESGTMVEIGGEKGLDLEDIIKGDLDLDYVYDVDITSAQRPDFPVVRKQLAEGINIGKLAQGDLAQNGKKFRIDLAIEDYFSTFDAVPDAKKYIQNMTEQEKQMMEQTKIASMMGARVPGAGPTPETGAITSGVERVAI